MDKSAKDFDSLPPEEEIRLAIETIKGLYGFTITKEDAAKTIPLLKDMGLWLSMPNITKSLTHAAAAEKSSISKKLLAILIDSRKSTYGPVLMEKTAKLFELQYNLKLDQSRLKIAIDHLSKSVWSEEALKRLLKSA